MKFSCSPPDTRRSPLLWQLHLCTEGKISLAAAAAQAGKEQEWSRETGEEAVAMTQVVAVNPGGRFGGGRKDLESGFVLKDELTEFDEFDIWV